MKRPLSKQCPHCKEMFSGQGFHKHITACSRVIDQRINEVNPSEIVNQIMDNPDTFMASIDTAIQSQRNRISGLKGEIEQAERIIGRLENFRGSLEFADNRKLQRRGSQLDDDVQGEIH